MNHPTANESSFGKRLKQAAQSLLIAVLIFSLGTMLAGLLGKWHYLLDLASHMRVQATMAVLVSGLGLWLLGRKHIGVFGLICGLALVLSLTPFYWPTAPVLGNTYRLMTANVLTRNPEKRAVLQWIAQADPDFVVLQETDESWTTAMELGLRDRYPYHRVVPREDNFGIAMFSKHRWLSCDVVTFSSQTSIPSIVADFELPDGNALHLIATHPLPPMRVSSWADRNRCFAGIAKEVNQRGNGRGIVAGDLNCTPWSYWFGRLLNESGLRDSSLGQGIQSTWSPRATPIPGLMIDHVLVGSEIEVADRFVGPAIGSDHRPVIVDFR
ncbi:endonuclease/exonuclease/phosphatase family protein [Novipirellula sp. SH528]|uniref:endonuclease/exonuclease/phosphatase family protein n=1 Tax=Novipirellula sp. SH528 TaxID=3454466 RepID=UPI003FA19675